jgi:hypothetical protein
MHLYPARGVELGLLEVKGVKLAVTRRFKPRVHLMMHRTDWGVGGYTYLQKISWEYMWGKDPKSHSLMCIFRDRDLKVIPARYLAKFKDAYAAHRKDSDGYRKRVLSFHNHDYLTGKVSPIVSYTVAKRASETWYSNNPGGSYQYRNDGDYPYQSYYHAWTSVRTPGFGHKRKSELPINNWSSVIVKTHDGQAMYTVDAPVPLSGCTSYPYYYHGWTYTTGLGLFSVPAAPVHSDVAYNKALMRLADKCGLSIEANLAQDLAQYGQTTRLFYNTCFRIAGAVKSLRRKQFATAVDYLWHGQNLKSANRAKGRLSNTKTLAENLLELQYGWKPLLKDVEGSIRALKQYLAADSHIVMVGRGSAREKSTVTTDIIWQGSSVGKLETVYSSTTKFGLRYKVSDPLKSFAAQLGFTNPVNLVWEMLPWSFVWDWALPIGTWLELMSSFDGLSFQDGFCTRFTKQFVSADIHYNGRLPAATGCYSRVLGRYNRRYYVVNRTKLTAFPAPVKPKFKNPITKTHVVNGLALLRTAFHSDPRSMRNAQKQTFHF